MWDLPPEGFTYLVLFRLVVISSVLKKQENKSITPFFKCEVNLVTYRNLKGPAVERRIRVQIDNFIGSLQLKPPPSKPGFVRMILGRTAVGQTLPSSLHLLDFGEVLNSRCS